MDEPSRILVGGGAFESGLLGAWGERQPKDASRLRALAAVGLGGVVGTASASIAPKALVASSSLLKWLMAGAGALATAGAVAYVTIGSKAVISAAPPAIAPVVAPAVTSAVRTVVPPAEPAAAVGPAAESATRRRGAETEHVVAGHAVASNPSVPFAPQAKEVAPVRGNASSLDEEVLAVDRARSALASGDARRAIEEVNAYDARYPNGALRQESAEIRIEAVFRLGDRPRGKRLADRFIAAYPTSPYMHVVRSLVDDATPPAP